MYKKMRACDLDVDGADVARYAKTSKFSVLAFKALKGKVRSTCGSHN